MPWRRSVNTVFLQRAPGPRSWKARPPRS